MRRLVLLVLVGITPVTARGEGTCPALQLPPGSRVFSSGTKALTAEVQLDARHVYWRDGDGRIWRAPKQGGMPDKIVDKGAREFVVVGETVYYATKRSIRKLASSGGSSSLVLGETEEPANLESDGSSLFYSSLGSGPVRRLDLARGKVVRRYPAPAPVFVALDRDHLYAASFQKGTIFRFPLGGGRGKVIVDDEHSVMSIAVDESALYYGVQIGQFVRRVPKQGGKMAELSRFTNDGQTLLLDGPHVYWFQAADPNPNHPHKAALWRTLRTGAGKPERVLEPLCKPMGLAADADSLYIANYGASTILKIPKRR